MKKESLELRGLEVLAQLHTGKPAGVVTGPPVPAVLIAVVTVAVPGKAPWA